MYDHVTQQRHQQHGSGTDRTMTSDDRLSPSGSGSSSNSSLGIGAIHAPALNVDPSVAFQIDATDQCGDGDESSSAASPTPTSTSSSSVSESISTSTSVEHGQGKKTDTATGVEQTGNQKRMRVQRKTETNNNDGEEQKNEQPSTIRLPPSISLSIAQRFHHDGLHSIFRWLTMRELNKAAQTCKHFYNAATSDRFRLGAALFLESLEVPSSFFNSASESGSAYGLRHHVNAIYRFIPLTMPQLSQMNLAAHNNIEKLDIEVTFNVNADPNHDHYPPPSAAVSTSPLPLSPSLLLLPPHLTSLSLTVIRDNADVEHERYGRPLQLLMTAIGSCHELVRLVLDVDGVPDSLDLDFSPLRRLTKLRDFWLSGSRLTIELADVLRELSLLEEVSIGNIVQSSSESHIDFLRVLFSVHDHDNGDDHDDDQCHALPHPQPHSRACIKSLSLGWFMQRDELALLFGLRSLTSLHTGFNKECSDLLPSLRLRHLSLRSPGPKLLSAASRMSTLTRLGLSSCELSDESGMELMRGLPCLETLDFSRVDLTGGQLECLKEATNLRSLTLFSCKGITEESLVVLLDTRVEELVLFRCVRLGVWAERCLRHSLKRFQYKPPAIRQ